MNNNFHEKFKKLRIDKDISQKKLGFLFNVSQQTINKWEHGLSEPTYDTLKKLAIYFEVTTDYLLGLSNNLYHNEQNDTVATVNGNVYGSNNNIGSRVDNRINIKK